MVAPLFHQTVPERREKKKKNVGLSRIAFLDGNGVVMLGKIVKKVDKVESSKKK